MTLIGTNTTVLWVLLPIAVLFAGLAPAAISFAAGQAAFTLTLLILFNMLAPAGWKIGLVRIEDVALGCAVSLVVGLLFWPRGAAAALGRALSEAYVDSADYLAERGRLRRRPLRRRAARGRQPPRASRARGRRARRLDDTFRGYLAERGAKPAPLAEVTRLVTGVSGRAAGRRRRARPLGRRRRRHGGDRAAARAELLGGAEQLTSWYDALRRQPHRQRHRARSAAGATTAPTGGSSRRSRTISATPTATPPRPACA